jgi:cysteine-rich repeat protein
VCGDGIVEPGESCDDGNTADGDCCSSGCALEGVGLACSDSNACSQEDACDGAGRCVPGATMVCDDGDPCTDDPECDPTVGCPVPSAKTGLPGVSCHLDAIGAVLSQAGSNQLTEGALIRIAATVQRVRLGVAAAVRVGPGRRGLKKLRNVEVAVRRVDRTINTARLRNLIDGSLADTLADQVTRMLRDVQALLTPA